MIHETAGAGADYPPDYEHSDIKDDYGMFSIVSLVITRPLFDEIHHLGKLLFDLLMMEC